jgi:hypothetical protein
MDGRYNEKVFISAYNNIGQGCVTLLKTENKKRGKETFLYFYFYSRIPYRRVLYCVPIV